MSNDVAVSQPKNEVAVIFEKINSGLKAFEEKRTELTELVEGFKDLAVESVEDRTAISKVNEARKSLKKERVLIQNQGKAMRDPLTQVNKQISSKEAELVSIIEPEEKRLSGIEDWVESEKDRIKQEELLAAKQRIQNRIDRLSAYGSSIDLVHIETLPDDQFEKVVERAKKEHELALAEKEAERIRQEKKAEQDRENEKELEKLRQEKEIAKMERREFRMDILRSIELQQIGDTLTFEGGGVKFTNEQVDNFLDADRETWDAWIIGIKAQLAKNKADKEEKKRKEQEEDNRILAEKKLEEKMKDARFEPRAEQLIKMGFVPHGIPSFPDFSLKDTWSCYWEQVYNMSDKEWPEYIKDIEDAIQRRTVKLAEEEKRVENARIEGIGKGRRQMLKAINEDVGISDIELGNISTEQWERDLGIATKLHEKRQKELADQQESNRLAAASDKDKYQEIVKYLTDYPKVEMKSAIYKKKLGIIKDFIADLK